jgi:hypothetical protein
MGPAHNQLRTWRTRAVVIPQKRGPVDRPFTFGSTKIRRKGARPAKSHELRTQPDRRAHTLKITVGIEGAVDGSLTDLQIGKPLAARQPEPRQRRGPPKVLAPSIRRALPAGRPELDHEAILRTCTCRSRVSGTQCRTGSASFAGTPCCPAMPCPTCRYGVTLARVDTGVAARQSSCREQEPSGADARSLRALSACEGFASKPRSCVAGHSHRPRRGDHRSIRPPHSDRCCRGDRDHPGDTGRR